MISIGWYKKKLIWSSCVIFPLILAISGCTWEKQAKKEDPFFEKWQKKADESWGHSPEATPRTIDLPERKEVADIQVKKAKIKRPLPRTRVTMTMRDTDVNVILRALARSANQNVMLNEGVKGVTNINVRNAPWDEVFLAILKTRGLTYEWEGKIIRVMSIGDMKYDLEVKKVEREKEAEHIKMKELEPLITRIIPIHYADAAKLGENLTKLLMQTIKEVKGDDKKPSEVTAAGEPMVTVDSHNNALIVHATRDDMAEMIRLVEELDRPTLQIRIHANIVETNKETARALGVRWGGAFAGTISGDEVYLTPGGTSGSASAAANTVKGGNYTPYSGNTGISGQGYVSDYGIDPGIVTNAAGVGSLGLMFGRIGGSILEAQLMALQEEGRLKILSSPSITTLDNQMAYTENGERVPFVTIDADGDQEVEFEDAVLRLEITPHVIDGRKLKMKILVKKDEVDDTRSVLGNPYIIKKQTATTLIVDNRETIVISGLTKKTESDIESGVPWLQDIPIMGNLFKGDSKTGNMEEVLIFITPNILEKQVSAKN